MLNFTTDSKIISSPANLAGEVAVPIRRHALRAGKRLSLAMSLLFLASCATTQPPEGEWREVVGSEPVVTEKTAETDNEGAVAAASAAPVVENELPAETQATIPPIREMASSSAELEDPPASKETPAAPQLADTQVNSESATVQSDTAVSRVKAQITEVVSAEAATDDVGTATESPVIEQIAAAEPDSPQAAPEPSVASVEENSEDNEEATVVAMAKEPEVAANPQIESVPAEKDSGAKLVCSEEIDGLDVGADGCAILNGALAGIEFGPGNTNLTDNAMVLLDSVATVMEKKQNIRLSVATYNQDLDDSALGQLQARRRTLAVIRYLISNGIESARVRPHSAPLPDEFAPGSVSTNLLVLQTVAE